MGLPLVCHYHCCRRVLSCFAIFLIREQYSSQDSLVKLPIFQLSFKNNCVCNKQKKSIKGQRKFSPKAFFKVFANHISTHSKMWCWCFSYEQNYIFFFISPVDDLLEIEECLHLFDIRVSERSSIFQSFKMEVVHIKIFFR